MALHSDPHRGAIDLLTYLLTYSDPHRGAIDYAICTGARRALVIDEALACASAGGG